MQHIPLVLHLFVVRALWRKLPVAGRLFPFHMSPTADRPLCGSIEDHRHTLKCCPLLSYCMCIVSRLWTPGIQENMWVEPFHICLDHSSLSVQTLQGWLVWSAIFSMWLVRCESLNVAIARGGGGGPDPLRRLDPPSLLGFG